MHKTLAGSASHHIVINSNLVMHYSCYIAAAELFASLYFSSRAVSSRLRTLVIVISALVCTRLRKCYFKLDAIIDGIPDFRLMSWECFIIKRRCFLQTHFT